MTDISVLGVIGTDGAVPVFEPDAPWRVWGLPDIWQGDLGKGKYVPKVKDFVIDPDTYTTFIVDTIDAVTLVPHLSEKRPANMSYAISENDVLFGVGPGSQSDTFRCYLDTSVVPFTLSVDGRVKVPGSTTTHAVIYRGTDLSDPSKIISRMYDASGRFVTNNLPLELVAIDSHVNYSIKRVMTGYTNLHLNDGEVVTVVVFDDLGHVVYKRQLLIENTSFIRPASDSQRYITSISLECAFMSPTQEGIIEFPLNVPINALNLIGVVHYSNGDVAKLPVDGTKFKIFGLDQYVSTIIGQKIDLVLSYTLSTNEATYGAVTSDNKYVTAPYSIVTVNPNNSYAVKVFGYPVWISESLGYTMRWFMVNLDRNVFFDVTPYVSFAANTGAFNPKGYGYLQQKAIQLNLRDVSGAFKPYVHTQLVDIILNGPASPTGTSWTVSNASSSTNLPYGADLFAQLNANGIPGSMKLDSDIGTLDEWLNRVYYQTYPLVNPYKEAVPPAPTHFEVMYANTTVTFTIDQWNQDINLSTPVPFGATVFIRFIRMVAGGQMELSVAAMLVRQ